MAPLLVRLHPPGHAQGYPIAITGQSRRTLYRVLRRESNWLESDLGWIDSQTLVQASGLFRLGYESNCKVNVLDDLGGIRHSRLVGLRLVLNAGLAALEWVQYWQCSLSNVGNRLTFIPASGPELPRTSMLWLDCGNVPVYWMEAYPGGPCSSRVRHVHPAQ